MGKVLSTDMLHDIQANGTALNLPCRFLCDVELLLNVIKEQESTFWRQKVFGNPSRMKKKIARKG